MIYQHRNPTPWRDFEPGTIPALTITQPWATAIALRIKRYETRGWRTDYRGPLAIHAAKGWTADDRDFADAMARRLGVGALASEMLPLGKVIAIADLRNCLRVDAMNVDPAEEDWGDYSPGRWAWEFGAIQQVEPHVPVRGMLGLWQWRCA